ncbi:MFS transporter [Methylophaga sp. OBS4]|uniref:MFS transporter n=1 Tax=Methylophaga sp. OBS4 TaxID=2991935 RepID=UPI002251E84A|nr:MFS transporter [Methylophaga sp. OBS4]MCX4187034.1 MFS transporter [Methylophaga sp. OBS4]
MTEFNSYSQADIKNRWLIALSAVGIHISIGSVYAWSVFNLPLKNAFDWGQSDIAITFSLAIFFLGMSAAVMGHFVERHGPRKSGMVAAAFWGVGLMVASLGIKLGVIEILWLGYGILGGIGLGIGYITPVSTLVKWFPDRRGLATGLAIMGFGFGAAIGGPVYDRIMSNVAAAKLELTTAEYRAGIASYNSAKKMLKDIQLNNESGINYDMERLLGTVKNGNKEEILNLLPEKLTKDAKPQLDKLNTALNSRELTSFWQLKGSEQFKRAIASGISVTFLVAGLTYLLIMIAAASYITRPPQGWMPARMKADVESGKKKLIPDLTQMTANAAIKKAPFYGLWTMMFINISCGIGIIYSASPLAQENIGLTPGEAAAVVGMMAIFNGLGRIGWASFSDFLGRANTYTLFFVLQIAAFYFLPNITSVLLFQVVLYLILTCYGGGFATLPAYIGDLFGTKELGAIHGYVLTAWAMAGVFGPQIVARLYEATGSYETVLQVFSGIFAVALAVSILMTIYIINARHRMTAVTIFKFHDQDFIRSQTNLLTADGKSAVNTKLDRDYPSYQALINKKSYIGEAILFGKHYETRYAPLTNEEDQLTGAIFVGNQQ